ncbi:NADH-ubiquinone oxidoreductase-F iron-sulfur binding region domain-containing protein [Mycobacterium sp. 236(2023)]|uniref:NADH-ubiquinone oxidoreductase-F iron-sulfur binding region domain-containing protein n=1 Tax=Mycobacterium sp. 236(2023) TaxID=3038163 RepID=UPI00241518D3|nr:NADH-ubiquinone oxidoreductase-F iron-sulfur binding region domain-containing protein [Mycobacterium sp. 236(2023)]MDG4668488.1 NADH-ubiquinone oxidoreductase-F iron-sulfur binding region domain-containing protein [Mycobacterium sp. 236(2023)]
MSTAMNTELTVAAWPGLTPRLLLTTPGTESLDAYRNAGGYQELTDPSALLDEIGRAGIVGRGGAAFPMAVKLTTLRRASLRGLDTVLVANGEEGEPASVKDRWLLRHRPHLVLDGVRLAARIIGARHAHVYVSDAAAADSVRAALAQVAPDVLDGVTVSVCTVAPGYVAGEETAAVRAINGGPAKPTDKPPRPFEEGVGGLPTAISNVETLANLPFVLRHGAAEYRTVGTDGSPGTFLATVTGGGRPPGLYEVPFGILSADLLALHGIPSQIVRGAVMGGYFAGLLDQRILETSMDHESLRAQGSGLGCGAVSVITDECPVAVGASVLAYYDRENADQCGSCFNGTAAMAAAAEALRDGSADAEDVARLRRWSEVLRGRGACATLDAACNIAASLLTMFGDDIARHLDSECPRCAEGAFTALRPFEVEAL